MPLPDARVLDFETAADAVTVTDVQISPDGRQVAYATSRATTATATPPVGTLWLVSAEGGPPKRLTASEAADSWPRWSPDGTVIFGACDERVPPTQGHELYQGLKARGVETQFVLYPREGHGIVERQHQVDYLGRVVEWFDTHLGIDRGGGSQ